MDNSKNVLVVGGTGFIGYHVVSELLLEGYKVTVISLPEKQKDFSWEGRVTIEYGDISKLSDEKVTALVKGNYAVVYCAGADDRITPPRPARDFFYKHNVEATQRFIRLSRKVGVKRAVILSSYFLYFERRWHELELARHHPYIWSRKVQAEEAIIEGGEEVDVMILELPYIFGATLHRMPLWAPLLSYVEKAKTIYYTDGGTNVVSVETVAEAVVGAIKYGEHGAHYTIGSDNITWPMMLRALGRAMGTKRKKIVTIPTFLVKIALYFVWLKHLVEGREGGLDPRRLAHLQTRNTFFDASKARDVLKFKKSNMEKAFSDTVKAWRELK